MICGILGLNTDLARAIALGHDLGHPPFGHAGEETLSKLSGTKFSHAVFVSTILQTIERKGRGLNLTHQVLKGITEHSGVPTNMDVNLGGHVSSEANVVRLADKFAYITADINDILRIGVAPDEFKGVMTSIQTLGKDQRERVNTLVTALCLESAESGTISFQKSDEAGLFAHARSVMKSHIYRRLNVFGCDSVLEKLYRFILSVVPDVQPEILVALLTDSEALWLFNQQTLNMSHLYATSAGDMISTLKGKSIDFSHPDLNW